ncbi:MAG: glycosyltransferase family protein [Bacteroidota bacterium]
MKVTLVVQARTGSSRLPGKVLLPVAGRPLLERMLERLQAVKTRIDIVVATTTEPADDPVRYLCGELGVPCFSGHPLDLLDRHYRAALRTGAEAVAKIPSDCPLVDPAVVDRVLGYFLEHASEYDYVSNLHPATYPDGNDVEVMHTAALETAWREAERPLEREHTTPFFWEHPERFRIGNVTWESGLDYSMTHRWTVDYPEDYEFIRRVYDELRTPGRPVFGMGDILDLLERKPGIAATNSMHAGVNWYRHHLHELKTVGEGQTRTDHPE